MSSWSLGGVQWLLITTGVLGILHSIKQCFAAYWHIQSALLWARVGKALDLRADSFDSSTNLYAFPRILEQLGLRTMKVKWLHDSNVQTEDYLQWGWMRLPCRSLFLHILARWGVSHYVYIPEAVDVIYITGPIPFLQLLNGYASQAMTRPLDEAQLDALRCSLGLTGTLTTADRICSSWERRCLIAILMLFAVWLSLARGGSTVMTALMREHLGVSTVVVTFLLFTLGWILKYPLAPVSQLRTFFQREAPQEILAVGVGKQEVADGSLTEVLVQPEEEPHPKEFVSLIAARAYYYESILQYPQPGNTAECIIRFSPQPQLQAVRCTRNLVQHVAAHTSAGVESCIHVVTYNPATHPHLTKIYSLFQKGVARENYLIVVLPSLGSLETLLTTPPPTRTMTAKSVEFVNTCLDLECLLREFTYGYLPPTVFVLPVETQQSWFPNAEIDGAVVRVFLNVFGEENCHLSPASV